MNDQLAPWLLVLCALCMASGSGCANLRRNSSPLADTAADDTEHSDSAKADKIGEDTTPETSPASDIVRLPPVDSSEVVTASAEVPFFYGHGDNASLDGGASPIASELPKGWLSFGKKADDDEEDDAPSDFAVPRRLPRVIDGDITYGEMVKEQWHGIISDHIEYYSFEGLTGIAIGLGAGAVMANTGFDEHFMRDAFVDNIILAPTHEYSERLHDTKVLGNGRYTIPVFAAAALAEPLIDQWPVGEATAEWGQRSLRTLIVGAPPMLALQYITGASRPGETTATSHWKPFKDTNGVSGHSFMGAIPFMSAAKMTDNPWLKGTLYAASTLPGLSRVSDDKHYFSQAFLGWWLAYMAESAIDRSQDANSHHHVMVYPQGDGAAVGVEYIH